MWDGYPLCHSRLDGVRLAIPAKYADRRWVLGQWQFVPADGVHYAKSRFILPVMFVYDGERTLADEVVVWTDALIDLDIGSLVEYTHSLFEIALACIWDKVQAEETKKGERDGGDRSSIEPGSLSPPSK